MPLFKRGSQRKDWGGGSRAALFVLVCLSWEGCTWHGHIRQGGVAGVAGELAATEFNYSVPSAIKYCPHQHCMRCSTPFEWDPHPYQPCRVMQSYNSSNDTLQLEVASSHLPFDGLLMCFTAPDVNLSESSVEISLITEGGKLYDTEGKPVYPIGRGQSFLTSYVGGSPKGSGARHLEAIEYGVLDDFLGNDEYYASTFTHQRYDQFRSWKYTSQIAAGLVRRSENPTSGSTGGGGANCMLLTSTEWKRRTRYELTLKFSGRGNINVSQHPVWHAPLKYEEYDGNLNTRLGVPMTEELEGSSKVVVFAMAVRGPKEGAVCTMEELSRQSEASAKGKSQPVTNCSLPGYVKSPRTGECITCPRLLDFDLDEKCQMLGNTTFRFVGNSRWTNEGTANNTFNAAFRMRTEQDGPLELRQCCASNTYPQLVGREACGATISPNPADADLLAANVDRDMPKRLCARFGFIREVFVASFCDLECLQDGNLDFRKKPFGGYKGAYGLYETFGSSCPCNVTVRKNASLVYNDAYMARVLVPAFMHEAVSLVDEYSLARAKRMAHSSKMDLDGRRLESPTRRRGLAGIWLGEMALLGGNDKLKRGDSTFYDMYNRFVDFVADTSGTGIHDERASVRDFDTQYYAELNLRYLGLLLSEPLLSAAPHKCTRIFDPKGNATDALMIGARDPYWPMWGHGDEF